MNKADITKPTRQALRGFVVIFVFEALKALRALWPVLIVIVAQKKMLPAGVTIPMVIALVLLLLLAHSILFYLNFYFVVDGDQFILKKGYLRKKVLSIPLERIQSVNTKQNILQQLLNVYSLEVDTAGSAGKEIKIYSLSGSYADALTHYLQSHKKNKVEDMSDSSSNVEEEILRLSLSDLLRIGISQNHLRTGLIIVAFGSQIIDQIRELFKKETDAYSDSVQNIMSDSGIIFYSGLALFFLVVTVLATVLFTVIKYYDFRLTRHQLSYRISAGLINKRKVLLPFSKVQQLNWKTDPIKRLFGIFKITFKQAVSSR